MALLVVLLQAVLLFLCRIFAAENLATDLYTITTSLPIGHEIAEALKPYLLQACVEQVRKEGDIFAFPALGMTLKATVVFSDTQYDRLDKPKLLQVDQIFEVPVADVTLAVDLRQTYQVVKRDTKGHRLERPYFTLAMGELGVQSC